jgi:hypothetical protein
MQSFNRNQLTVGKKEEYKMSSLHSGEVLKLIAEKKLIVSPILSKKQIGPISIRARAY